jgi:hypothetical protein
MNTERWYRIEALFERALELPEAERGGFLDEACAGDPDLRRELAALIAGSPTWAASVRSAVIAEARRMATDAAAQVGRRIGPFRLVRLLGEGGMGAVYFGERDDAQFVQRVAIKIVPRTFSSPSSIARFRDERQILAALEHPNIVRLLDGGSTDDGMPYLVMEYIEGPTITEYATRHQLSVRRRVELVRQVCAALQYAHGHLVVHRDIKPNNVLVAADGAPKILDFGIAKLVAPIARFEREARTVTGTTMFTPEYASPEQARGDAVSTASDVYSVGALLYELMTCEPPLRPVGNAVERLRVICEVEPARPSAIAPGGRRRELAGDLDNIILKALHKVPEQRYASMEELSNDLLRWLDGRPVTAQPSTLGYRGRKFVRRNKATVIATSLVAAMLLAATVVSLREAHRADDQAMWADASARKANDAAARAQTEAERARSAERLWQSLFDELQVMQSSLKGAEEKAKAKAEEAEGNRRDAEAAKQRAERESARAQAAEVRAEGLARREAEVRRQVEELLQMERDRVARLRKTYIDSIPR